MNMAKLNIECCPICCAPVKAIETCNSVRFEYDGPRWISVEERLPENFVSVIGYLPIDGEEGLPPTREVYHTERGWFAPALGELCIVTHWMSMPEAFREV
jgi:hypothetical protein